MKKVLLTIAAIALFAAPASAQMYSLWTDETMTSCDYFGPLYAPFNVVIIIEPPAEGVFGAEYKFVLPAAPSNVLVQTATPYADISVSMGDAYGGAGISLGFTTCQTSMFVVYTFEVVPLAADAGFFQILPNDDSGIVGVALCEPPDLRPTVEASVYNMFGWNDECVTGTEESSWGAIKSMMD